MQEENVTAMTHSKAAAEAAKVLSDLAAMVQKGPQPKEEVLAALSALSKTGARVENDFMRGEIGTF